MRVGGLQQSGLVARRVAQMTIVTCASPAYPAEHGEPRTPDDLHQHRLIGLAPAGGGSPEWTFPPPYTSRRLKLRFAMLFNSAEAPTAAAVAGMGIIHTADMLIAAEVARGQLKLILNEFVVPGPPMSLVYPSAGHQAPKVRVFSDFAVDLLRRYQDTMRQWVQPVPGGDAPPAP